MKLSSMRYKNYTWPHNPKTFVVEYRRQIAAQKVPMGGCILQDLGVNCRILRGEGEFAGPDAYEDPPEASTPAGHSQRPQRRPYPRRFAAYNR